MFVTNSVPMPLVARPISSETTTFLNSLNIVETLNPVETM